MSDGGMAESTIHKTLVKGLLGKVRGAAIAEVYWIINIITLSKSITKTLKKRLLSLL